MSASKPRYGLPAAVADTLDRGGKIGDNRVAAIPAPAREAIGRHASRAGIGNRPGLEWIVRALRDRIGGFTGTPTPPASGYDAAGDAEREWLRRRLEELELEVRADLGASYRKPEPRVDVGDYTNPDDVLDPRDTVVDLAARRRAREHRP